MSIAPIKLPHGVAPIEGAPSIEKQAPATDVGGSFAHALDQARALDHDATAKADAFAANDSSVGIHEVMIATEKANIALRFATTVKNKALEAYRDLMNTNV